MVPPDVPRLFWLTWFVAGVAFEWYAIKYGGYEWTATGWFRWILGTGEESREWFRWLARAIMLAFLVWLIPHFMTMHGVPDFVRRLKWW